MRNGSIDGSSSLLGLKEILLPILKTLKRNQLLLKKKNLAQMNINSLPLPQKK